MRADLQESKKVIAELGTKYFCMTFQRSRAAISQWNNQGMPVPIMMVIKASMPTLKAFGGPGIPGISK